MPDVLLLGDKKGNVNIVDTEKPDEVHPPLVAGRCPILGLVWMQRHPQTAICGMSELGEIKFLRYDLSADLSQPVLQRSHTVQEFPKLSSLSANCSDDFLLASGFSTSIAVYDVQTGKVLHRAHGVHEHFINISRFSHNSPHIFATASFDHTCKVWDLRQPLLHDKPLKTLSTGGLNVMCTFSPDDKHVLCSGVDTRLVQFEIPSWRQTPGQWPLREPMHRERYRRSIYLASSQHFVTAATEESHMHLMSVHGKKLGVVDFRGIAQDLPKTRGTVFDPPTMTAGMLAPSMEVATTEAPSSRYRMPRLAAYLENRLLFGLGPLRSGSRAVAHSHLTSGEDDHTPEAHIPIRQGVVELDDADPNGGSTRKNHEFVQSIRAHPALGGRVGALLSRTQGEQSYVALVDLDLRGIEEC
jgi:hypothetical protein